MTSEIIRKLYEQFVEETGANWFWDASASRQFSGYGFPGRVAADGFCDFLAKEIKANKNLSLKGDKNEEK